MVLVATTDSQFSFAGLDHSSTVALKCFFFGCAVGVTAKDGLSAKKPWRIMTSSKHLANDSLSLKCSHSEHAPLEGQWIRKSAFYPKRLCVMILQSLLSRARSQYVFSMPCVSKSCQPLRQACRWVFISAFGRNNG